MTERTCKKEGCHRVVKARGLCGCHYTLFQRRMSRAGIKLRDDTPTFDRVSIHMPATINELIELTGFTQSWLRQVIIRAQAEGNCHIEDFRPPQAIGERWTPIYAAGKGEDATVTKRQKNDHALKRRRELHFARRAPRHAEPMVAALFGMAANDDRRAA